MCRSLLSGIGAIFAAKKGKGNIIFFDMASRKEHYTRCTKKALNLLVALMLCCLFPSAVGINFSANGISISGKNIPQAAMNKIVQIKGYQGNIVISSVARTPEQQARCMLNNIKSNGMEEQRKTYKYEGQQVLNAYNPNLSDEENVRRMTQKIKEVGPHRVSRHCVAVGDLCVFDVEKSSLSNVATFKQSIRTIAELVLDENNCVHVEMRIK